MDTIDAKEAEKLKCPHGQLYLCEWCGGSVGEGALSEKEGRPARPPTPVPRPPLFLD